MATVKWTGLKDMKDKRVFCSLAIGGDNDELLFVVGGCDVRGQPIDTVECYNRKKCSWKSLAAMSTKRAAPAVQLINNHILAVGGVSSLQQPLDIVETYSLATGTWTQRHPIAEPLLGIGSFVYDGSIYIIGGMRKDTTPSAAFLRYDQPLDQWSAMKRMPTARYATYQFLIGCRLYVIGGRVGKLAVNSFEMYDFESGDWTKLTDIPSKRIFASYTATEDYIYSLGGLAENSVEGFTNCCETFDLKSRTWIKRKGMMKKRGDFISVGKECNKILISGGLDNQGKPLTDSEIYDPSVDAWRTCEQPLRSHASASYLVLPPGVFGRVTDVYVVGGLSDCGPSSGLQLLTVSATL